MVTAPPDTVNLTINGRAVEAPKGMLLIEAARLAGIDIPIFCYEPRLKPVGACRMCLVQIEKLPRLQTACTTPVAADMIVHSNTPDVVAAQNGVLELLLANHPLDCPICDKGGECPLQDNTFTYGPGASRFTEEKRHKEKAFPLGEQIVLDRERCIMCYRCVRFHQEIVGDEALAAVQRGPESEIATPTGEPYNSLFAGNTIELCPVGALTSRQYRFKARPWDLVRTPSVCNGCAVGCNVEVHSRSESVLRLVSRRNPAVDDGWLCDRGRFLSLPEQHPERTVRPQVRRDGVLVPATWEHALRQAAESLGNGGGAIASAGLSNEAFWLLQRLTPRVPAALWPPAGDPWPVEGTIANLARCHTIVLVGLDAWTDLPVLALWIRKAVQAGARLIVLGHQNGLWRDTAEWLTGAPLDLIDGVALDADPRPPAALLVNPALVAAGRTRLLALAQRLGASGADGLVGAPILGANGRGAQMLAPDLVKGDPDRVLASSAILALGDEPWADLPTGSFARLIVATSRAVADDARIDVVLPMAHAYERQGTLTNLEGRLQHQDGGAAPPPNARADWGIVAGLARALGVPGPAPDHIDAIRTAMAEQHPAIADDLQREVLLARV